MNLAINKNKFSISNFQIISSGLLYYLLISFFGYKVGIDDSVEFLPYVLFQSDKSLYNSDLFIQSMENLIPNERLFYAKFLSIFGSHLEFFIFIFHFLFITIMIIGMFKIASIYIKNHFIQFICVAFIIFLSKIHTGANVFYYPDFQGATVAKSLCCWGLYFLIIKKPLTSIPFIIIATFFQPLVGFHFFILYFSASIYLAIIKSINIKHLAIIAISYLATAGILIAGIKLAQGQEILATISDLEYIHIAFYMRLPHHFIPTAFSIKGIIIMSFFYLFCITYFYKKQRSIFIFLMMITLGIIIYIPGTLIFKNMTIISSWWFRTTIWIKLLGIIAISALIEKKYSILFNKINEARSTLIKLTVIIILTIGTIIIKYNIIKDNHYHFPWLSKKGDDILISRKIKELTPKNAVFIQPFNFTALKYYGERSSYVEFKTIARRRDFLKIWYNRLQEVYGINYAIEKKDLSIKADIYYKNLNNIQLENFKKHGITHILTYRNIKYPELKIITESKEYIVYEL